MPCGIAPPKPWFLETDPRVKMSQTHVAQMKRDRDLNKRLGIQYEAYGNQHRPQAWEWRAGVHYLQRYTSAYGSRIA